MARVRMVTRTVEYTAYNTMVVDITTQKVDQKEVIISGNQTDLPADKALKAIAKQLPENEKPVHVVSFEIREKLYGMPEEKFIQLADVLPPRGSKEE